MALAIIGRAASLPIPHKSTGKSSPGDNEDDGKKKKKKKDKKKDKSDRDESMSANSPANVSDGGGVPAGAGIFGKMVDFGNEGWGKHKKSTKDKKSESKTGASSPAAPAATAGAPAGESKETVAEGGTGENGGGTDGKSFGPSAAQQKADLEAQIKALQAQKKTLTSSMKKAGGRASSKQKLQEFEQSNNLDVTGNCLKNKELERKKKEELDMLRAREQSLLQNQSQPITTPGGASSNAPPPPAAAVNVGGGDLFASFLTSLGGETISADSPTSGLLAANQANLAPAQDQQRKSSKPRNSIKVNDSDEENVLPPKKKQRKGYTREYDENGHRVDVLPDGDPWAAVEARQDQDATYKPGDKVASLSDGVSSSSSSGSSSSSSSSNGP